MKRSILRAITAFLFGLAVLGAQSQQQQQPLPPQDPTTVEDLFNQLGRCNATLTEGQKYKEKLVARIRELEATLKKVQEAQAAAAQH